MKKVIIDGSRIESRADMHDVLAKGLDFPEWYGKNLDALHDCLTDISEECEIVIENDEKLRNALERQYKGFMKVFEDAAEETGKIKITKI